MKLLVVEDEERMARMLQRGLQEEGHQVDVCTSAQQALEQGEAIEYDVVLLDWGLPDADGVSVLRRWRERGVRTPVLMLTARGSSGEKVTGLRAGADDYLVKPFDFEELLARLEALHRRGGTEVPMQALGDVEVDGRRRVLKGSAGEVPLTAREFGLLAEFARRRGEVLSRSRLLAAVWGGELELSNNVVDVYVGYLRSKLERVGSRRVGIASIRGIGYRLSTDGADGR